MKESMMRKQIYLPRQQNQFIKRRARQRGISEAEVIRQALERDEKAHDYPASISTAGWGQIQHFVNERQAQYAGQGKPAHWNRQELYEENDNNKSGKEK